MASLQRSPVSRFDALRRGRWVVYLWLIPAVCVGLTVGYWIWSKRTLSQRLDRELMELRQAGLPVDQASLDDYWRKQTSSEFTDQWLELLHVDANIYHRYLVRNNVAYRPQSDLESPPDPAEEAQSRRAFLDFIRPILDKFRQMPQQDQLVWLPPDTSMGGGYYWHLQQAQVLGRLFHLELEDALQSGDRPRAISAVQDVGKLDRSLAGYLRIFDVREATALRMMQWAMLRQCLEHGEWTKEELSQLFELTDSNFNPLANWEPMIHCFRVMLLMTAMEPQPRMFLPGQQWMMEREVKALEFLEVCQEVLQLPRRNVPEMIVAIQQLVPKEAKDTNPYVESVMPSGKTFALFWLLSTLEQLEFSETQWKLTRSAIAIRLYRQTYGQWPDRLEQLSQVGLRSNEWNQRNTRSDSSVKPFGYEVHEDAAYVWMEAGRQRKMPEKLTWPVSPETAAAYHLTTIRYSSPSEPELQ